MSYESDTVYLVELTAGASLDLALIYEYIDAGSSQAAAKWYNALEDLIYSLSRLPHRGSHVNEDSTLLQLLHGNKPHIYRIIYSVDRVRRRVEVVHIRHGAQDTFKPQYLQ